MRPDLAAFSRSIANGFPLAAVTGTDRFREAATQVFSTGSFWCAAVPMAAGEVYRAEFDRLGPVSIRVTARADGEAA